MTAYDVDETGKVVAEILEDPEKYVGKTIPMAGDDLTAAQYVEEVSKALNKPIKLNTIPYEVFSKFPFPGAHEMAEMYHWFEDYGYFGMFQIFV